MISNIAKLPDSVTMLTASKFKNNYLQCKESVSLKKISTVALAALALLPSLALDVLYVPIIFVAKKILLYSDNSSEIDDEEDVIDLDAGHPVEQRARRQHVQLELEIEELKQRLRNMDGFIRENPELAQMCQEILQRGYIGAFVGYQGPDITGLDPDNPIDKWTLLQLEKNHLEAELEERKVFLERNPQLARRVQEILNQPIQQPMGNALLLL